MGERICAWLWAKMPGLIMWSGELSEWQLIAAAVGGLLLMYAIWTALYNGWLVCRQLWPSQSRLRRASSPRGGALRRIISAPTRWDEEPYEEWMAEEYVHGHYY